VHTTSTCGHVLVFTCVYVFSRVDDEEDHHEHHRWETISLDGQIVGTHTPTINEECQAFVIYCSTVGGRFRPYFMQSLKLTLPALHCYFHKGVREAACRYVRTFSSRGLLFIFGWGLMLSLRQRRIHRLIPLLTSCGKSSSTLIPWLLPPIPNSSTASRSRPTNHLSPHCTKPSETRCMSLGCTPKLTNRLMDGMELWLQNKAEKQEHRSGASGGSRAVGAVRCMHGRTMVTNAM
jgi:hypothetical protein